MADYRNIHTKIWTDEWFLDLTPDGKLLWIYLFSNKRACLSGLYDIPMRLIAFETGLDKATIERLLVQFRGGGKAFYEDGWMLVPNLMKYNANNIANPKILGNIRSDILSAPNIPIKRLWLQYFNTAIPPEHKQYAMTETDIGYTPIADRVSDTVSDTSRARARADQSDQSDQSDHLTKGAIAPPVPSTFEQWREGYRSAENPNGYAGWMLTCLYPGYYTNSTKPNYGMLGKLLKANDAEYVLSLAFQHSARPPAGDPIRFLAGVVKKQGGGRNPSADNGAFVWDGSDPVEL